MQWLQNNFVIQSLNKNCMTIECRYKLIIGDTTEYLNVSHDIKYKNMKLGWNKNTNKKKYKISIVKMIYMNNF